MIRDKPLIESTAADLIAVLAVGKASTCHFLRRFHNLAVDLGWLPWPILPNRLWPKAQKAKRRGITLLEHEKILGAEQNIERKLYYELLWETGASQTDAAQLTSDNINWDSRVLAYHRQKLAPDSKPAVLAIGKTLERILKQLPAEGPLFPHLIALKNTDRAAEFYRRCHLLGIKGVSLHSYRYAWAERAKVAGIPQRWAEAALGHSSAAIHRAYAQGAQVVCPPLDEYADTRGGNSGSFQRV